MVTRYIVTIDAGTTNTRALLWKDRRVVSRSFVTAGVRDTAMTGSTDKLLAGVRGAISQVISQTNIKIDDIGLVLATGMSTSNVGLLEVPHITAPAGISELAGGMRNAMLEQVCTKEIWFVPGVKNNPGNISLENIGAMDIMRGEEVETFGIMEKLSLTGPCMLILPGSHTKYVTVDGKDRIDACLTTLAGELLSALTNNTILADTLRGSFVKQLNEDMLIKGSECSAGSGLSRAAFLVRIMDLFTEATDDAKASFLLGAVLDDDICALRSSPAMSRKAGHPVVIGGNNIVQRAYEVLLGREGYLSAVKVDENLMSDAAGLGAIAVAVARGLV